MREPDASRYNEGLFEAPWGHTTVMFEGFQKWREREEVSVRPPMRDVREVFFVNFVEVFFLFLKSRARELIASPTYLVREEAEPSKWRNWHEWRN